MSLQGNVQNDQFAEDHVFDPLRIRDSEFFFLSRLQEINLPLSRVFFFFFPFLIKTSGEPFNE